MDEVIDLALEGRFPHHDKPAFIGADTSQAGHEIYVIRCRYGCRA